MSSGSVNNPLYLTTQKYSNFLIGRNQNILDETARSLSSGGQTDLYNTVESPKKFLDFKNLLERNEQYAQSSNHFQQKVDLMITQMSTIRDLAVQAQQAFSNSRSNVLLKQDDFRNTILDKMSQLETFLNEKFNGEYVFGGTVFTQPPVKDLNNLISILPGSGPDTSYYQGNTERFGVQSTDTSSLNAAVNASSEGFEKLIRALRLGKEATLYGGNATDQLRLSEGNDLCLQAIEALTADQGVLAATSQALSQNIQTLTEQKGVITENIQTSGYKPLPEMMNDYIQSKITASVSQEISIQLASQINDFVKNLPTY